MSVKENLIKAKALIASPEKWAVGQLRNNRGCLCALGAIGVATNGEPFLFDGRERDALLKALPDEYDAISIFNDGKTHADVMSLFDRAIAAQDASE